MKRIHQIIRSGGVAATLAVAVTLCVTSAQAGDTKKFTETGQEYLVTSLATNALLQPLFVQARATHGAETARWSGVAHQFSENNVGGKGSSVAFEQVHGVTPTPEIPTGTIVYAMKYETVANGDRFVMAGKFIPQLDGSYVCDLRLVPDQGTGRFAGATGTINVIRAIPGGYVMEGTITDLGEAKQSE
jgi:hypothetical protein